MIVEFEYDEDIMHSEDQEAKDWFYNEILLGERLTLFSNEAGDFIGDIKILEIKDA